MSAAIGHVDAYPYSFPGDDLFLFVQGAERLTGFVPHGTDEAFTDPHRPVSHVNGVLAQRCLADVRCHRRFRGWVDRALRQIELLDLGQRAFDLGDRAGSPPAETAVVAEFLRHRRETVESNPGWAW